MAEVIIRGTDGNSTYNIDFGGPIEEIRKGESGDSVTGITDLSEGTGEVSPDDEDIWVGPLPVTVRNTRSRIFGEVPDIEVEFRGDTFRIPGRDSITFDETQTEGTRLVSCSLLEP